MQARELIPSAGMGFCVIAALALIQLLPYGEATVLVKVPSTAPDAALMAAASTDAALVATPATGVAVLHGDASRIRKVLGVTITWHGRTQCFQQP